MRGGKRGVSSWFCPLAWNPGRGTSPAAVGAGFLRVGDERHSVLRVPFGGGKVAGVNEQRRAGDTGGVLAAQKKDRLGHIARPERNTHRDAAQARGERGLGVRLG